MRVTFTDRIGVRIGVRMHGYVSTYYAQRDESLPHGMPQTTPSHGREFRRDVENGELTDTMD